MRKIGSNLECAHERNIEVMNAYRQVLRRTKCVRLNEVLCEVVKQPASRFWVSEERATKVMYRLCAGEDALAKMRGTKRRMYEEIYKRLCVKRSLHPEKRIVDLVREVVYESAPEFYMQPLTAKDIICNVRNGR